jgi:hypothetical protein
MWTAIERGQKASCTIVEPSRKSQKKRVHANSLCVAPLKAPMSLLVKAEVEAQHAILLSVAPSGQ